MFAFYIYIISIFHFHNIQQKKIISKSTPILFSPISSSVELSDKTAGGSDASVIAA